MSTGLTTSLSVLELDLSGIDRHTQEDDDHAGSVSKTGSEQVESDQGARLWLWYSPNRRRKSYNI